jgi:RNA polymerase sigma-70 factor (ECF subfamily)
VQNSNNKILYVQSEELIDIEKCKQGDVSAFKNLMNKHIRYVASVAQKYIWIKEDVEEVVQEVFVKVWQNIGSYDSKRKFTTWLYRITVNCCFDLLRKQKINSSFEEYDDESKDFSRKNQETDKAVLTDELITIIKKIAAKLSNTQRIVFTMIDLDKITIKETSEILSMSTSSVKANLSYARKEVRTKLAKYI